MPSRHHPLFALLPLVSLWLFLSGSNMAAAQGPVSPLPSQPHYDLERALLGRQLFFDPRLSREGDLACADCHRPGSGGAGPGKRLDAAHGQSGAINPPSVFNAGLNFRQTWNGRAADLRELLAAQLDPGQGNGPSHEQLARLLRGDPVYRTRLADLYPDQTPGPALLADALSEFIQALATPNARFDRWLRGELDLTPMEHKGFRSFKALGCISCHNGINLGGNSYQYQGAVTPLDQPSLGVDRLALTGDPFDRNRFRVPSLRNVALTAPYLHDGSVPDLRALLYLHAYHNIGFQLTPQEAEQLIAFLNSLTGERPAILDLP